MTTRIVIDASTGEATEVPLTPEEEAALAAAQQETSDQQRVEQWNLIESTRGAQLTQTDWLYTLPADTPTELRDLIAQNQADWDAFRQGLRDIMNDTSIDPVTVVWPSLPPAPTVTITPPPDFVQHGWPPFVPAL